MFEVLTAAEMNKADADAIAGGIPGIQLMSVAGISVASEITTRFIPCPDFPKVLKEGRPLLVDVVPPDGNAVYGHEVVLMKTFQHEGKTWYAMMDSNQGPVRRLYVSAEELGFMLRENGVAFQPERNTTIKPLRKTGTP